MPISDYVSYLTDSLTVSRKRIFMKLIFTSPFEEKPGIIARLLNDSYAELVETEPEIWEPEKANWEDLDRNVFEKTDTIGACTFLSRYGKNVVGFFSFDPRSRSAFGVVGHNCILPEYRKRGFGTQQVREMLLKLRQYDIKRTCVSTLDHPFFIPAQRMYVACGFVEVDRIPWDRDTSRSIIFYEKEMR